jgi:hypothetical protein
VTVEEEPGHAGKNSPWVTGVDGAWSLPACRS